MRLRPGRSKLSQVGGPSVEDARRTEGTPILTKKTYAQLCYHVPDCRPDRRSARILRHRRSRGNHRQGAVFRVSRCLCDLAAHGPGTGGLTSNTTKLWTTTH